MKLYHIKYWWKYIWLFLIKQDTKGYWQWVDKELTLIRKNGIK